MATSAMPSVTTSVKNTFLHFDVDPEQSPSNDVQPSLGRARTMPTPSSRLIEGAEDTSEGVRAAGLTFGRSATEETLSSDSQGQQPEICGQATFESFGSEVSSSIKNTFLHFHGDESPSEQQPSLGRAVTMPTPELREKDESTFDAGGSRFAMPDGNQEDDSDADSFGPQPDICRDMTFDAFGDDEFGEQPTICRDTTYDAFDAEDMQDRQAPEPQPRQVEAKPKIEPTPAWQAQQPPPAATGVSTVVLPNLLTPLLAGTQVVQSAGQPALMLVGMPTPVARPPTPEPVKPSAPPAAAPRPAPAQPAARQGGRRQSATKAPISSAPPPPPGACELSEDADTLRLRWTVDARKLRKNERVIVSPLFDLPIGNSSSVPFRLMLFPSKGAGSFRASNGVGTMLLKCEATAQESPDCRLELRFLVGRQPPRGPVSHNFSQSGVCSLPEDQQEWSFARATDQATQTVGICLEIVRR